MKHQLLPRSTGLRFCLNELKETTEWLYDCTIAYEGVPPGQFGQDIFTLRSSFFEGRPPKSVNMHWRRFHISTIPIQNTKAFEVWLRNRWREKDYMLEYFSRHTRFPAEEFWKDHLDMGDRSSQSQSIRSRPRPAVQIETQVKSANWNDFVKIFAPITGVMTAMSVAYGSSPVDLIPGGSQYFEQLMKSLLSGGELKGLPSPDELEKMIEGAAKLGANQAASPGNKGRVQHLTQENLAKLVKETAIKEGVVLPGGMRRASTALPQAQTRTLATSTAPKAKSATAPNVVKRSATAGKGAPTVTKQGTSAARPNSQQPLTSQEMREVTLASGVTIKVRKTEVEKAKDTGTIKTANGLSIKVGRQEIEKAEAKKGAAVMTSSGVPIKITQSGALNVGIQTTNTSSSEPHNPKYVFRPTADLPTSKASDSAAAKKDASTKKSVASLAAKPTSKPNPKSISKPTLKPTPTPTSRTIPKPTKTPSAKPINKTKT